MNGEILSAAKGPAISGSRLRLLMLPLLAVLPLLVFALLAVGYISAERQAQIERQLVRLSESALGASDLMLANHLASLDMLVATASLPEAFLAQASKLVFEKQRWLAVYLIDNEGKALRRVERPGAPLLELIETEPPNQAGQASAVAISSNGTIFLALSQKTEQGFEVRAALPLEPFSAMLQDLDNPQSWLVAILDPSHRIAGRSRNQEFVGNVARASLVAMIDTPEQRLFFALNQEGERVYTAIARSSRTGWSAAVGAPAEHIAQMVNRSRAAYGLGVFMALAVAAVFAWLVGRSILRRNEAELRIQDLENEKRTESRLQDIAANFPGVLYRRILHPDGTLTFPFISSSGSIGWAEKLRHLTEGPVPVSEAAKLYADPETRREFARQIDQTARTLELFRMEGSAAQLVTGQATWLRSVASTRRLPDGRVVWDGAILDITELKQVSRALEERTAALESINAINLRIAAELNVELLLQQVTDTATHLVGASFGAFFENPRESGDTYQLYTLSGVNRVRFDGFPMPRHTEVFGPTLRGEETVLSDDITADPRYGNNSPYFGLPEGHLPVRSYLAVPVKSRSGEVLGGLFFGHPKTGMFRAATAEIVEGIAAQMAVALDNARLFEQLRAELELRKRSEEAQRGLLAELNHRVKNTLAVVVSIADQTSRESKDHREFTRNFRRRLIAISDVHSVLADSKWIGAELELLIERALQVEVRDSLKRTSTNGPQVLVPPRQAVALSLIFHELAWIASTFGALSGPEGRLAVHWSLQAPGVVVLDWAESGAPLADPPPANSFARKLIELNVRHECDGSIEGSRQGDQLKYRLTFKLRRLEAELNG